MPDNLRGLTAFVVGLAVILLPGCGSFFVHTGKGITVKNPSMVSSNKPVIPSTEPAPKPQTNYPQFATKGLVPEAWSVPAGDVAITIDDGPSPYTEQIIKVLNRYGAHATFFFVGERLKDYPNAVRDALNSGDIVGNHSETHPLMTDLSQQQQELQIDITQRQLEQFGDSSPMFYRPPYGSFNDSTEQILSKTHLILALWNRDPRDWAASSSQQVIDAVINGNPSGGVFDMHDKQVTLEALPTIIETLQKRGLHFVALGEVSDYSYVSMSQTHSNPGVSSYTTRDQHTKNLTYAHPSSTRTGVTQTPSTRLNGSKQEENSTVKTQKTPVAQGKGSGNLTGSMTNTTGNGDAYPNLTGNSSNNGNTVKNNNVNDTGTPDTNGNVTVSTK